MIGEISLNFKSNNKSSKLNYPQCRCSNCPQLYLTLLSVASRVSRKTTNNICKFISHYEQNDLTDNDSNIHPLQTIVISPTLDANPIFKGLSLLDEADINDKFSDELLPAILGDKKKIKMRQRYLIYSGIQKKQQNFLTRTQNYLMNNTSQ